MQTIRREGLRAGFPLAPLRAERLDFGLDDLHAIRSLVAGGASAGGLSPRRISDLVVAASELAANSILHGGGRGLATVWEDGNSVSVEVETHPRAATPSTRSSTLPRGTGRTSSSSATRG